MMQRFSKKLLFTDSLIHQDIKLGAVWRITGALLSVSSFMTTSRLKENVEQKQARLSN